MTRNLRANMDSFMTENVHFLTITNCHKCQFSRVVGDRGHFLGVEGAAIDKIKASTFYSNLIPIDSQATSITAVFSPL